MQRTRVRICGVRRGEDAPMAAHARADALGMVFYAPAARNCPQEVAQQIISSLPAFVTPVALFMNESAAVVRQQAARLNIIAVQLHGDETPEFVESLAPLAVIKTLRLDGQNPAQTLAP